MKQRLRERKRGKREEGKEINAARAYRGQKGPWEAEAIPRQDLSVLSGVPRRCTGQSRKPTRFIAFDVRYQKRRNWKIILLEFIEITCNDNVS